MDTLPTGRVVVTNPAAGIWDSTTRWQVIEEVRIGAEEGDGPEVFGQLGAMATDLSGRLWVMESKEQVLKVFDTDGRFVRTIGRRGGGPGEFANVAGVAALPDGRMLTLDHQNARISWFDTAGAFLSSKPVSAGFQVLPWPGRVLRDGTLYDIAPAPEGDDFGIALVRYDSTLTPVDTLLPPTWQGESNVFLLNGPGGRPMISATVPYSPGLQWQLAPDGTLWFVHTGTYELYQVSSRGDTTRVVTKPFERIPVTGAERDTVVARMVWFTRQGGVVDAGKIPGTKPAVGNFAVAEDGYLWVAATLADTSRTGLEFDIFDPEGRFLGALQLPFRLSLSPRPVIGSDRLIGVTTNEDGVQFLVRARIER